jgi:hypothetical protein
MTRDCSPLCDRFGPRNVGALIRRELRSAAFADFTTISLDLNDGNTGTPNYVAIGGANTEMRFSDSSAQANVASASWPAMIRPAATAIVPYAYAFTADATGQGVYSGATSVPATFSKDDYLQGRWNWDAVGTYASAPIFTAYDDTNHNSPTVRGGTTNNILSGNVTDTGATARSYLKGNLWGRVSASGAPAAGPTNAPVVTDGTTGSVSPTAGANWLANFQGLMADLDYITFPNTPAATTAGTQHVEIALFTGPNMGPKTYTPVITLKYTWT